MLATNSLNRHLLLLIFFLSLGFFSCNMKRDQIAEEIVTNHLLSITKDSLITEAKEFNKLGTLARNKALYKEALNLHFQALALSEQAKDTLGQISAINNIGTDLRRTYSNQEASTYHYLALEMSYDDDRYLKSRAIAMNGLGNIFLSLEKPKKAKEYFKGALNLEKKIDSNLGQAINFANLAETFNISNELDSAVYYYKKSLEKNITINSKIGEALCKRSLGLIAFKRGNKDEALLLLKDAYSLVEYSEDAFHKLEIQQSLVELLINNDDLGVAENQIIEIISLAKEINSHEYQNKGYELLAMLKEKQQQYKLAFDAQRLAFREKDNVLAQNSEIKILELENRYRGKETAQQLELLRTEKALTEKNKIEQQRIFFLLLMLLALFTAFLYYRYKNKLKISSELKKINSMKSKFFGNVTHEFRTPLTLIKGILEKWNEDNNLPQKMNEDIKVMRRNSDRLLFLVEQLLSLSKVDSGNFTINPQNMDLALVIRGITQSFLYLMGEKSIEYEIDIKESGKRWIDLEIVEIIITNLLSNALKFTDDKGKISLKGYMDDNSYIVKVANTNSTLTQEQLPKIFDRYYSSNPIHFHGTGIGLSLVKELCTLYSADLSVNINKNEEVEFSVAFPSLNQEIEVNFDEEQTRRVTSNLKSDNIPIFNNTLLNNEENLNHNEGSPVHADYPLLLVVEDNDDLRKYIIDRFKDSYNVIEAKDGEQGIEMAKEQIPDIIISDIMMPKVNGLELCKTLKTDITTNHIPIILLTALSDDKNVLIGLRHQADDYVVKPFGVKVLKHKVRNLIEVRNILSKKYRNEILIKPLDLLIKGREDQFVEVLKDVVENHLVNPNFGVDDFCSVAAMSRAQLYRKLKATVDMSVAEFIRVHRVKLASEMLRNTHLNITEICYSCGFTDTSYFSKSFKDVFKMPPAEYRKSIIKSMPDSQVNIIK